MDRGGAGRAVTRRQALRQLSAGLLALPLLGAAPRRSLGGPTVRAANTQGALTLPSYQIEASVDVDGARLGARQVVRFRNAVGKPLESVVFRAVPGAWGALGVDASAVDGQARDARLNGSILEVPFLAPLADGAETEIELRYSIRIPREPNRIGVTGRAVALGNWFPILTVHRGDWDRRQYVEAGDAFYTEVADYDVTLTTSQPLQIAATGRLVEGDGARARFVARSVRDFALAAGPWTVRSVGSDDGQTTVTGYAASAERAQLYAERGAAYLRWFGTRLGAYPYPHLAIADVDLPASYGGMEYPGLVMLSGQLAAPTPFVGSDLDTLLAHEIAHQWFYSWVGNDQFADPWLDEAFATYLPVLYYADTRPDLYPAILGRSLREGGNGPVDSAIADFSADPPYYAVVYRRGARFLHALRDRLGDATFAELLRDHVTTHRDRLATPRAFLDRVQASTTTNLNPLIAEFFRYGAFHYPNRQTWTLEAPTAPWRDAASVFIGAEFPITRVELWLDSRLLAGGTENAVTVDLSGVPSGEYVLLARVWNHEGAIFERARRVEVA